LEALRAEIGHLRADVKGLREATVRTGARVATLEKAEKTRTPASVDPKPPVTPRPVAPVRTWRTSTSRGLRFDVIRIDTTSMTDMISVKVKITNDTDRRVASAQVACSVLNGEGREIAFQKHYAIRSFEGGLAPGASTRFNYVITTEPQQVRRVKFHVESIEQ